MEIHQKISALNYPILKKHGVEEKNQKLRLRIVRKNQNTLPPGRGVSTKRSIREEAPARERVVNIGIRPSANSIKMKRVVRLKKCLFPHYNADKLPKKR